MMSEVLCPVCGKSNPPDLEFCQKCQARLKLEVDPFSLEDESADSPDPFRLDDATEPEKFLESESPMPDWLQSEHQASGEQFDQLSTDDAIPEWLADQASSSRIEISKNDSDTAERLAVGELEDEEVPEWLSDLGSGVATGSDAAHIEVAGDAPTEDDEEPEWLSRVRARKRAEEGEGIEHPEAEESPTAFNEDEYAHIEEVPKAETPAAVEPHEVGEDEYPDWLTGSDEMPIEPKIDEPDIQAVGVAGTILDDSSDSETEIPDWVSALSAAEIQPDSKLAEDQAEADLPEWLDEGVKAEDAPSDEDEEVPEWVAGLAGVGMAGAVAAASRAGEEPEVEDSPEWQTELEEAKILDEEVVLPTGEEVLEVDSELSEDLETVDRLTEREAAVPELEDAVIDPYMLDEQDEDLFDVEVAEWLSEIPSQDILDGDTALEEDEDIEPAELPIWLAAMRPVEAVAQEAQQPDEMDQKIESSGPLAGLSGILPAEPAIARVKKTSAYAIKLRVSDNQQAHAGMLEELIKNEGTVESVPERARISSQQVLRLSIFIILLLAVLGPVLTGSQNIPLPALAAETLETRQIVDAISGGAPVLLAVEYEPGLSGEMEATSASLIDHLMIRGAFLTLVSTSTMGPAQAERLVSVVNNSTGHDYEASSQYVNLGYIPGGPTGLLGFANGPRQILPFALDNSPTWESGPLSNVQDIADFELVVVITESSDSARAWIEQVQPALADTPLIMVVSAQAEPLIRPYYEGSPQQVNGMVTGLAGGASYEKSMPRTSLARKYWDAFSFGLLAAVVLIALGGVVVAAYSSLSKRNQTGGEQEP
jgi:hypothetical protein